MSTQDTFAIRMKIVDEAPEPFRRASQERLLPRDSIRQLVFNPAHTSMGVRSPATLLAVTDSRWLAASDDADGRVVVVECGFGDTLLVELTAILLYGRLKLDYVAGGEAQAVAVEFNTVMEDYYREAVRIILDGVSGEPEAPPDEPSIDSLLATWPLKFRNAVPATLPEGRRLLAAVHWPAVHGGFRRELAPAGALLAADRELVLLSEEQAWTWGPEQAKYGRIATYFPLVRLARFDVRSQGKFGLLDLEMHAHHGGETLHVVFPAGQEQAVAQVVNRALRRDHS